METMLRREVEIVTAQVIDFPVEALQETARMLRAIREWQKPELERCYQYRRHNTRHNVSRFARKTRGGICMLPQHRSP